MVIEKQCISCDLTWRLKMYVSMYECCNIRKVKSNYLKCIVLQCLSPPCVLFCFLLCAFSSSKKSNNNRKRFAEDSGFRYRWQIIKLSNSPTKASCIIGIPAKPWHHFNRELQFLYVWFLRNNERFMNDPKWPSVEAIFFQMKKQITCTKAESIHNFWWR